MTSEGETVGTVSRPCRVVRSGGAYQGKQGLTYLRGLSGETVGSTEICLKILVLSSGSRSKAHLHRRIETAVYVLDGRYEMFYGPRLKEHVDLNAADYAYIPCDTAHMVINRSGFQATVLVAHSASSDQEGIVLLPELDTLIP